jgi:antirestriction protein ArdC
MDYDKKILESEENLYSTIENIAYSALDNGIVYTSVKNEKNEKAEKAISSYTNSEQLMITHMSPEAVINAHYNHTGDFIVMPDIYHYKVPERYYETLFHEIGHSTGFVSRLNRNTLYSFSGTKKHCIEEMAAELFSMFCHKQFVSDIVETQKQYIKHFLKYLHSAQCIDVKNAFYKAYVESKKAFDYFMQKV